jgi:hypothetical protein
LHASHRTYPKCFQGCVIQFTRIVFLHVERESWLNRHVKENLTLLMD